MKECRNEKKTKERKEERKKERKKAKKKERYTRMNSCPTEIRKTKMIDLFVVVSIIDPFVLS